jgi:hypothetical protein
MISLKELCAAPLGLAISFCSDELQCFLFFRNQHRVDSSRFLGFPVFADCKGTTFILTLQKFLKIFYSALLIHLPLPF